MKKPAWVTRAGLISLAKRKTVWAGLGGVAGLGAGVAAGALLLAPAQPAGLGPHQPESVAPPASSPAARGPAPALPKGFRVLVPSIGTDAPVISAGATDGSLDVPSNVHEVAWWDGVLKSSSGPTAHQAAPYPGQPGVALLAGHVDSVAQGHGVFYKLKQARPGAEITVIDAHQKVTRWKITRVQTVYKGNLPAGLFVTKGAPQLALVSCGGPYDAAIGHYLDNVIAWAKPA